MTIDTSPEGLKEIVTRLKAGLSVHPGITLALIDALEAAQAEARTAYLTVDEDLAKQIATLTQERDDTRRWNEELAAFGRSADSECAALRAQLETAKAALREARDDVVDWGAYANGYFQHKHGLKGDLARIDAALAALEGKATP